ncbi:TonB-dependent receptor [Wenyingzhuangia sp. chi5]|uniref:TonB-dependent receptor n=1 Tax=Wenyingzhuangia gilva TaxID=3057677 RepID=A0ABT8VUM6_9FLAO|nr:TonB-dependent receptor [Wenyingzhuangia sp. chi5]MDO3695642.1 TonB-dependent receptor [Wenyingzhuangia sp. chi5]
MEKLKLLMIAVVLCFSSTLWAQSKVTGVVTDANDIPVPGANIIIKGTSKGTIADFDGNFEITASNGDVIAVSYVGYTTKEIAYTGQAKLSVKLEQTNTELDEVVIVGYGTVKRKDVTGSVASMDAEQIQQTNKVDAVSALQGQAPGVVVQRTDNKPGGGGFNIRIRGASSINVNENSSSSNGGFNPGQNPLFIVDGIFVDDISFLNPADISRMDILKDASATAIYGSRGSNGVVLIETKGGKKGVLKVDYSNYVGFKQAYHLPSVFDGSSYVDFVKDAVVGTQFASGNYAYRKSDVVLSDYFDAEELQNVADGVSTDWVDLMLKNGLQTNHTINMSGGTDKTIYSVGLAYTKDEGTARGEDFTRYNIRGTLSSDLTKWLNVSVSNYITNAIQNSGSWEGFRSAYRLKPIGRPYDENGDLKFFPTAKETQITNPLFEADNVTRETKYLQYLGDFALKVTPIEGLTLTSKFSPNIKYSRYGEYRGLYSKSVSANPANRRAQVNNDNYFSYSWDNILNYKFETGIHAIDFTGVFSRFSQRSEGYYTQVRNFTTDDYSFYNLGAGLSVNDVSSGFSKQTLESYTARVNYSLMDKYLITLTGRYDGASKLAEGNKWAFFPSAAFAWKISEEDFMKSQNVLTNAKLRVSYGQTGNTGEGLQPLGSQSLLDPSATNLGDAAYPSLYVGGLANKNLKWERTAEVNVGFDFGLLNNRINGSVDVYHRKNTDLILYTPLSNLTGFPGVFENIGESSNKGIEIGLNTTNINSGGFKWTTNFNFASNKNNVDKLYGGKDILFGNYITRVGQPVGAIYDYEFAGIWQLDEEAEALSYEQKPGQVKVTDVNKDGKITPEDRKIIGQTAPKWTGGITNTMNYKDFDFSFMVNISQGNTMRSNFHSNYAWGWQEQPNRVFNGYDVDYWTPENQSNDYNQPGNPGPYGWAIQYKDVSFVKVGYVTLGYKFPSKFLDKINVKSLRIYGTVQNPFIFTDYDGWDPENASRNQWGAAFMSRTFMTGLNLSF